MSHVAFLSTLHRQLLLCRKLGLSLGGFEICLLTKTFRRKLLMDGLSELGRELGRDELLQAGVADLLGGAELVGDLFFGRINLMLYERLFFESENGNVDVDIALEFLFLRPQIKVVLNDDLFVLLQVLPPLLALLPKGSLVLGVRHFL